MIRLTDSYREHGPRGDACFTRLAYHQPSTLTPPSRGLALGGGLLAINQVELSLLFVAQGPVEVRERGTPVPDRHQHGVEPHRDRAQARGRRRRHVGGTDLCQRIGGICHRNLERIELGLLLSVGTYRLFDPLTGPLCR